MENPPKVIRNYVGNKIHLLISREEPYVRATLAQLRRGIGRHPGSMPDIWDFTLGDLPGEFHSQTGDPTPGEWAAHIALTLFALHQQGKNLHDEAMSVSDASKPDRSLGHAVRTLVMERGSDADTAIRRRFSVVVTSDSTEELAHHLRGLIQLLRNDGIALDYPRLAEDLYKFQLPALRDGVRLRWAQDYYIVKGKEEEEYEE